MANAAYAEQEIEFAPALKSSLDDYVIPAMEDNVIQFRPRTNEAPLFGGLGDDAANPLAELNMEGEFDPHAFEPFFGSAAYA